LNVGQRLQIPLGPVPAATETQIADNQTPQVNNKNNYYTVKPGENLWSIAKAQKTSVDNLAQLNDMNPQSALKPGQKLIVLSQASSDEVKESRKLTYTVKAGDTLGKIGSQYKVSPRQIMQWNNIKDETSIKPQQELTLMVSPDSKALGYL
jgi:membrane-bound lytic murein transglycosylase D